MTGPKCKITIPEKPCDINQTQMNWLRLLTSSSSSKVVSFKITFVPARPVTKFLKSTPNLDLIHYRRFCQGHWTQNLYISFNYIYSTLTRLIFLPHTKSNLLTSLTDWLSEKKRMYTSSFLIEEWLPERSIIKTVDSRIVINFSSFFPFCF